jgi:hypothetical protein
LAHPTQFSSPRTPPAAGSTLATSLNPQTQSRATVAPQRESVPDRRWWSDKYPVAYLCSPGSGTGQPPPASRFPLPKRVLPTSTASTRDHRSCAAVVPRSHRPHLSGHHQVRPVLARTGRRPRRGWPATWRVAGGRRRLPIPVALPLVSPLVRDGFRSNQSATGTSSAIEAVPRRPRRADRMAARDTGRDQDNGPTSVNVADQAPPTLLGRPTRANPRDTSARALALCVSSAQRPGGQPSPFQRSTASCRDVMGRGITGRARRRGRDRYRRHPPPGPPGRSPFVECFAAAPLTLLPPEPEPSRLASRDLGLSDLGLCSRIMIAKVRKPPGPFHS